MKGNRGPCGLTLQFAAFLFCTCLAAFAQHGQAPKLPPAQNPPQTGAIRVKVGLVQTDVMVFDKQGRFVPDLKMNQFELRVDGKTQPVSFFEMVSAGSPYDEAIWAKASGTAAPAAETYVTKGVNPGRVLLFFIDDWHLCAESVIRTREALKNLVNTSVGPHDRVAILSASGQLGPTHEPTNDKATLIASLERLKFLNAQVADMNYPPMTEGQAFLIEQHDGDMILYFYNAKGVTEPFLGNIRKNLPLDPEIVREIVNRAARVAAESATIGERTLSALREFVASSAALPGRKAIFFLSDGFVLQTQRSNIVDRLSKISDAAARVGIVIYSLDTRGLVIGLPDATGKRAADMTGALAKSFYNEVLPQQDALNALALDTGGRFLRNTNALDTALITTLTETSRYYLLGWYIDPEKLQPGRHSTIKASIRGRSDLSVRVRQGSLDLPKLVQDKK